MGKFKTNFLIYSVAWIFPLRLLGVDKKTLDPVLGTPVGLAHITNHTIYFKIKAEPSRIF